MGKISVNDLYFLFASGLVIYLSIKGVGYFFGFGHKKRHANWSSEQGFRRDKHYAEYFKGI